MFLILCWFPIIIIDIIKVCKKTLNKPFKLPGITSDIYADVYDAIH